MLQGFQKAARPISSWHYFNLFDKLAVYLLGLFAVLVIFVFSIYTGNGVRCDTFAPSAGYLANSEYIDEWCEDHMWVKYFVYGLIFQFLFIAVPFLWFHMGPG